MGYCWDLLGWVGGMNRAPPARDSNEPASMAKRKSRTRCKTTSGEAASGGKVWLGDNPSRQLAPSIENPGTNPATFSSFDLIYDDLRQPIPAPGIVAIGTAVANSSRCAVPQQSSWPAGTSLCDCMFWGEKGGGLIRQPMGPSVSTAIMTKVLSTDCVDSKRVISRGCALRLTHTSADPIRLLYIRLVLPLTRFLLSKFRARHKTHGWCFTSGPMACGGFFV